MTKVIAIIQARMGSTRLPGKVMMKLKDKVVLDYVIDRVSRSKKIDDIVLAITTQKKDDILEKYAKEKKINYFRGSEEDVLERYYYAAKEAGADVVVRITSDCPLIDPKIVDEVIEKHLKENADFTANVLKRTYPRGLDTEVFSFEALKKSYENAYNDHQREHVTPFMTEQPDKFKLANIEAEEKIRRPDLRITLDTKEDFDFIEKIISHFENMNFGTDDVIDFINENPELLEINKNVKQK